MPTAVAPYQIKPYSPYENGDNNGSTVTESGCQSLYKCSLYGNGELGIRHPF